MIEQLAMIGATGVTLLALTGIAGALATLLWLLPAPRADAHLDLARAHERLWATVGACLLLLSLSTAAELLLRAADMSGQPLADATAALPLVLLKTQYGTLWLWRAGAIMALWLTWAARRRWPHSERMPAAGFAAVLAATVVLSASGHAGDDGFLTWLNLLNSVHILGAFLWGGGMLTGAFIVLPTLTRSGGALNRVIADASARLSTLSTVALVMVLAPGIWNAWLLLGRWQALWESLYGQLLSGKILLFIGMVGLGAINRFVLVPRIELWAGRRTLTPYLLAGCVLTGTDPSCFRRFARALIFEAVLLFGVLVLAATLAQQTPTVHEAHHDGAADAAAEHSHQH